MSEHHALNDHHAVNDRHALNDHHALNDRQALDAHEAPDVLVDPMSEEMSWQERALCAQTDPESFFPEKGGSTREAKRICISCEVKDDCLDYALANDERFGIWGGLSERERRRLKRLAG